MPTRSLVVRVAVCAAVLCAWAIPAIADWDPGDDHKMHFPQLPDQNGWDVSWYSTGGEPMILADDWTCSQTGPVTDVHVWFSARQDQYNGDLNVFNSISMKIWSNNPVGPGGFSVPEQPLWNWSWFPGEPTGNVTVRQYGQGDQGWIDFESPFDPPVFTPNDHTGIWQLNVTEMVDYAGNPFSQQQGEVYWLSIVIDTADPGTGEPAAWLGWKTSLDHHLDDAVWGFDGPPSSLEWHELRDQQGQSMDLAFVITPEPATLSLLALGGLAMMRRRRRV